MPAGLARHHTCLTISCHVRANRRTLTYSSAQRWHAMSRNVAGFHVIDWVVLIAFIAIVWLAVPIAKTKFKVISANSDCMTEVEVYAASALRAIGNRKVPAPPNNHACIGTTDASRGVTLQTDITARAKSPGDARFICDLNVRARCIES